MGKTNLSLDGPVLLNEHGRHLLSITEVGTGSYTEVTTATSSRGVDPLQGSSLGVDIIGSLTAVLGIEDISRSEGKRLSTKVVGRGNLHITVAVGPLYGSRLVVRAIVIGQVIDHTTTVVVIDIETSLQRLRVGLEVRAENEVDAPVTDIDVGANAEARSVVGNIVDNIKAIVGNTDREVIGVDAILAGSVRQAKL